MREILDDDIVVTRIYFANIVHKRPEIPVHRDRRYHGFAVVYGGTSVYLFDDGKEYSVSNGDVIYLPKYSSYTVTAVTSGDCCCINFDIASELHAGPFVFTPKNHFAVDDCFKTSGKYWGARRVGYEMKCRALLYELIYCMKSELSVEYASKGKYALIEPAIEYIHSHYTEGNISIAGLSELCGISHEYFRKLFRSFYNTSPIKYINNLKLTRAKELIESGMYTVTDAALESGYTDISHFSREFKKATGISPSLYGK